MVNDESPETVELDGMAILVQMLNERVLQAGLEDPEEGFRFLPRAQPERNLKTFHNFFFSTFPLGHH
jgi:hypothetical protein